MHEVDRCEICWITSEATTTTAIILIFWETRETVCIQIIHTYWMDLSTTFVKQLYVSGSVNSNWCQFFKETWAEGRYFGHLLSWFLIINLCTSRNAPCYL
jgi:hypothetical protein